MPPATNQSSREILKAILLDHLYIPQREFWKSKLQDIIDTNRILHQKRTNSLYGIHYLNRNWEGNAENLSGEDPIFLTIHPELLDREKEILEIVGQLSELEIEEYEVNRFLSGLVLFPAPYTVLEKILGKQLSEEIRGVSAVQEVFEHQNPWDKNADAALMTYVNQHNYILKAMNERLLINLITQDQTR